MRILQTGELGFHNRHTAGRCITAVIAGQTVATGPLPAEVTAPLREELTPVNENLEGVLADAAPSAPALASALAVALQRIVYDKPWRSGAFAPRQGDYGLFLEYAEPDLARLCLATALQLMAALFAAAGEPDRAQADALRKLLAEHRARQFNIALHLNAREIVTEAEARGIPWSRLWAGATYYRLGQGHKLHHFRSMMCNLDSILGAEISHSKLLTSRILSKAGLPVPTTVQVADADVAVRLAERIGYPVVIKPNALLKGTGVAVNLTTAEEVRQAYAKAAAFERGVNIERMVPGDDHRILIVSGRFVAAARREPAKVIGDGRRSLRELIALENENPLRRLNRHFDMLTEIEPDSETDRLLARQGLTFDSVPAEGQAVQLKATANIASGGTAVDVTEIIHPDNVRMAERAAQLIDVEVAGIDYITTDIARSHRETGGKICEVNTWVSLAPHRAAQPRRDVIGPLVDRAFPPGDDGRIPIAAVTGGSQRDDVVRRLAGILDFAGFTCGATTAEDARIGGARVALGNHASARGGELLLADPACTAAALALDPGDMAARGLVFDRCSVAAVVGFSGLDEPGRNAAQRLAAAAREAIIVEAGDAAALEMARALKGPRVVLVSEEPGAKAASGETAVSADEASGVASLVVREGRKRKVLGAVAAGDAERHAALAAAAIAYGMGVESSAIAAGLAAERRAARKAG